MYFKHPTTRRAPPVLPILLTLLLLLLLLTNFQTPLPTIPLTNPFHQFPPTQPTPPFPPHPLLPQSLHKTLFTSYANFHHEALTRLRTNTQRPTDKYLIWSCGHGKHECAGVGDRFRGILTVYMLAVITGRVFGIEWREGEGGFEGGLEKVLGVGGVDWRIGGLVGDEGVRLPWYRCEWKGVNESRCKMWGDLPDVRWLPGVPAGGEEGGVRWGEDDQGWDYGKGESLNLLDDDLGKRLGDVRVVRVETRLFFRMDEFVVNRFWREIVGDGILEAGRLGATNDLMRRLLFRWLFGVSEGLERRIGEFELKEGEYVGVHVRNGVDFGEDGSERFKKSSKGRLETAENLVGCLKELGYTNGTMFLASDDYKFKSVMREFVRKDRNWKLVYNDAPALHNDLGPVLKGHEEIVVEKGKLDRNNQSGLSKGKRRDPFVDIFADLFLLARAKVIVGATKSGFTNLAFALGNATSWVQEANSKCQALTLKDTPIRELPAEQLAEWL